MINYGRHHIDNKDIYQVIKTLRSDKLTQGNLIEKFEHSLKKKFRSRYACVLANGSAALHLSCIALNVKNTIVLTASNTFLSSSNAIIHAGGHPEFVDIDYETCNISILDLERKVKKFKKKNKKISALIATDFGGSPCDWKKLKLLALKYKFKLVNDNCHAIGAKYLQSHDYASKYADIVTHSYHPVKHITTGEGGAVLSNNKFLVEKIKILRNHGLIKIKNRSFKHNHIWPFKLKFTGFNYRISDIQCALGISQLKKLGKFLKKRREIALRYNNFFKKYKNVEMQKVLPKSKNAYHLYVIRVNFKKNQKKNLIRFLKKKNINLQTHYFPIHKQPFYKKYFKKKINLPKTEKHFLNSLSLPIFYNLKIKDQKKIIFYFIIKP